MNHITLFAKGGPVCGSTSVDLARMKGRSFNPYQAAAWMAYMQTRGREGSVFLLPSNSWLLWALVGHAPAEMPVHRYVVSDCLSDADTVIIGANYAGAE
jgi:hypothetical protein